MLKQDVIRHYGVTPEKLLVIYGSIDTDAFHPGLREPHRVELRKKLGIPKSARVAIYVGSGFERKGVLGFLLSVAKVDGLRGIVVGRDKHSFRLILFARQQHLWSWPPCTVNYFSGGKHGMLVASPCAGLAVARR